MVLLVGECATKLRETRDCEGALLGGAKLIRAIDHYGPKLQIRIRVSIEGRGTRRGGGCVSKASGYPKAQAVFVFIGFFRYKAIRLRVHIDGLIRVGKEPTEVARVCQAPSGDGIGMAAEISDAINLRVS